MWGRAIVTSRWCVLLLLGIGFSPGAPVLGANPDAVPVVDLRHIKKFVAVEVQTQGTAEKLGISAAELTDVTRVTLLKGRSLDCRTSRMTASFPRSQRNRLSHVVFTYVSVTEPFEEPSQPARLRTSVLRLPMIWCTSSTTPEIVWCSWTKVTTSATEKASDIDPLRSISMRTIAV